jgi:hypothetical protein
LAAQAKIVATGRSSAKQGHVHAGRVNFQTLIGIKARPRAREDYVDKWMV